MEADRFFNYPYNALEEALVNAVLHKNYKEDVPVEIRIYLDRIQIINFPGPDHYIDMEKFAAGKVRARRCRNPKIGEFMALEGMVHSRSRRGIRSEDGGCAGGIPAPI